MAMTPIEVLNKLFKQENYYRPRSIWAGGGDASYEQMIDPQTGEMVYLDESGAYRSYNDGRVLGMSGQGRPDYTALGDADLWATSQGYNSLGNAESQASIVAGLNSPQLQEAIANWQTTPDKTDDAIAAIYARDPVEAAGVLGGQLLRSKNGMVDSEYFAKDPYWQAMLGSESAFGGNPTYDSALGDTWAAAKALGANTPEANAAASTWATEMSPESQAVRADIRQAQEGLLGDPLADMALMGMLGVAGVPGMIGGALGASGTAATAIGSGLLGAGKSALSGGDIGDALQSGLLAGGGSYLTGMLTGGSDPAALNEAANQYGWSDGSSLGTATPNLDIGGALDVPVSMPVSNPGAGITTAELPALPRPSDPTAFYGTNYHTMGDGVDPYESSMGFNSSAGGYAQPPAAPSFGGGYYDDSGNWQTLAGGGNTYPGLNGPGSLNSMVDKAVATGGNAVDPFSSGSITGMTGIPYTDPVTYAQSVIPSPLPQVSTDSLGQIAGTTGMDTTGLAAATGSTGLDMTGLNAVAGAAPLSGSTAPTSSIMDNVNKYISTPEGLKNTVTAGMLAGGLLGGGLTGTPAEDTYTPTPIDQTIVDKYGQVPALTPITPQAQIRSQGYQTSSLPQGLLEARLRAMGGTGLIGSMPSQRSTPTPSPTPAPTPAAGQYVIPEAKDDGLVYMFGIGGDSLANSGTPGEPISPTTTIDQTIVDKYGKVAALAPIRYQDYQTRVLLPGLLGVGSRATGII